MADFAWISRRCALTGAAALAGLAACGRKPAAKGLTAILLTQRVFDSPAPPQAHKDFWRDAYGSLG